MQVVNHGRVPAHELVVIVHLPPQLHVLSPIEAIEHDLHDTYFGIGNQRPEPPSPPAAPELYASLTGLPIDLANLMAFQVPSFEGRFIGSADRPRVVEPEYSIEDHGTEVRYSVGHLLHGDEFATALDPMRFLVEEHISSGDLELPYSIHAANLSSSIEGTLTVSIVETPSS